MSLALLTHTPTSTFQETVPRRAGSGQARPIASETVDVSQGRLQASSPVQGPYCQARSNCLSSSSSASSTLRGKGSGSGSSPARTLLTSGPTTPAWRGRPSRPAPSDVPSPHPGPQRPGSGASSPLVGPLGSSLRFTTG